MTAARIDPDIHGYIKQFPRCYGKQFYSQYEEDRVIEYLFAAIGTTNKRFVEIGVHPTMGNAINLWHQGWRGWLFDKEPQNARAKLPEIAVKFITAENVNAVLAECGVPPLVDFFSLDVDGMDYWIWQALNYDARIAVVEYNPAIPVNLSLAMPYNAENVWGKTAYFGASLLALNRLGTRKGYLLVYGNAVNAFFVKRELVANPEDFVYETIYRVGVDRLIARGERLGRWADITCGPWDIVEEGGT